MVLEHVFGGREDPFSTIANRSFLNRPAVSGSGVLVFFLDVDR